MFAASPVDNVPERSSPAPVDDDAIPSVDDLAAELSFIELDKADEDRRFERDNRESAQIEFFFDLFRHSTKPPIGREEAFDRVEVWHVVIADFDRDRRL